MIVDTVQGDPVIKFGFMRSGGKEVPSVVTNDRFEYGFINMNMSERKVEKRDVPANIIFEDFVGYLGLKEGYNRLKEIGFKFE
jgi:hypothetical protein